MEAERVGRVGWKADPSLGLSAWSFMEKKVKELVEFYGWEVRVFWRRGFSSARESFESLCPE